MSFLGLYPGVASRLAGVVGFTYVPFFFPPLSSVTEPTFFNPFKSAYQTSTICCSPKGERSTDAYSFAFQTAFAAYSVPNKTDRFYDLAGSLGFISTTLLSLVRIAYISHRGMKTDEAVLSRFPIFTLGWCSSPIPTAQLCSTPSKTIAR